MIFDSFLPRRQIHRGALSPLVALGLLVSVGPAAEEGDPVLPLDTMVISATRTPQEATMLSSSVSLVKLSTLDETQVFDLRTALETVPGVSVATSGGAGAANSVFIRGASSHQVLFLVDGVRMNDRSTAYFNFLGGADLRGLDRLEVLRGPQSTLYGSSAIGGVILMETTRGQGETAGLLSTQIGSQGTRGGSVAVHGSRSRVNFAGSFSYLQTENGQPQNDFDQWSGTARLEGRATENVRLGATVRTQRGTYEEPGSRFFPYPGVADSDNTLATTYAEWSDAGAGVVSRLTYGHHARDYAFTDAFARSPSQNRRDVLDWQTSWDTSPALEIVGGVNAEWSRYTLADWRTTDRVLAAYLSGTARLTSQITLNAGLRHDDFRSVGAATTGRVGAAWLVNENRTKFRATFGTGFTAPGSDDRFGVPQWGQIANSNLRPEKSTGWDVGVDHSFADGRITTTATFFQNRFRDLFDYDFNPSTFEGQVVNRARAETRGIEVGGAARIHERVTLTASTTWLEAFDRDTRARLIRRPKHTTDLDARVEPARGWLAGVGAHIVLNRLDSTMTGIARIDDYTTVRAYVSWAVREDVTLRLRVENALDKAYDDVAGYTALPRAVHGSVDWRF